MGSVVTGQPSLEMTLAWTLTPPQSLISLDSDAFELVPAYEFGDTPTGANHVKSR
jgi:hypothetical protein